MLVGERVQRVDLVGQHDVGQPAVDHLLEARRHARAYPGCRSITTANPASAHHCRSSQRAARRDDLLVAGAAVDVDQDRQLAPGDVAARVEHAGRQPPVGDPLERGPRRVRRGRGEVRQRRRPAMPPRQTVHCVPAKSSDADAITSVSPPTTPVCQPGVVVSRVTLDGGRAGAGVQPEQVLLARLAVGRLDEQVAAEPAADPAHVQRRRADQACRRRTGSGRRSRRGPARRRPAPGRPAGRSACRRSARPSAGSASSACTCVSPVRGSTASTSPCCCSRRSTVISGPPVSVHDTATTYG